MHVPTLDIPKADARKLAAEYLRSVRERRAKELDEVQRRLLAEDKALLAGYRAIAKGNQVLHLGEVIAAGGVDEFGRPKLAACLASAEWCWLRRDNDGAARFYPWSPRQNWRKIKGSIGIPRGTLPTCKQMGHTLDAVHRWCTDHRKHAGWDGSVRALVPSVPAPLRPAHHLRNYVTLFEVPRWETMPRPPGDPFLLKHLDGQLYAVVAQWDLTPLEKAVMAGRSVR